MKMSEPLPISIYKNSFHEFMHEIKQRLATNNCEPEYDVIDSYAQEWCLYFTAKLMSLNERYPNGPVVVTCGKFPLWSQFEAGVIGEPNLLIPGYTTLASQQQHPPVNESYLQLNRRQVRCITSQDLVVIATRIGMDWKLLYDSKSTNGYMSPFRIVFPLIQKEIRDRALLVFNQVVAQFNFHAGMALDGMECAICRAAISEGYAPTVPAAAAAEGQVESPTKDQQNGDKK